MTFENLIGQIFYESELFELLQLEIEENFDQYLTINLHIFFERSSSQTIEVSEIIWHENSEQLHAMNKKAVEKREFFYIYFNHGHIDLGLCRFDRSNPIAVIRKNDTFKQDWGYLCYADEFPDEEITSEEIRRAFAELSGCLEKYQETPTSKNKKAA